MQNAQLQAMTVVQLRKLAKENGVKLSAGIDKSGIVARLSEALPDEPAVQPSPPEQAQALHEPDPEPEPAPEAQKEDASPAQTQEKLQEAPLSADVTAVSPEVRAFVPGTTRRSRAASVRSTGRHGKRAARRAIPRRRPLGSSVLRVRSTALALLPAHPPPGRQNPRSRTGRQGSIPHVRLPRKTYPSWMDTAWDIVRLRSVHPIRTAENMLRVIRDTMAISSVVGISKAATGPLAAAMDISSSAAISHLPRRSTITTHCTACRATRNLQPRLRKARFPIC